MSVFVAVQKWLLDMLRYLVFPDYLKITMCEMDGNPDIPRA